MNMCGFHSPFRADFVKVNLAEIQRADSSIDAFEDQLAECYPFTGTSTHREQFAPYSLGPNSIRVAGENDKADTAELRNKIDGVDAPVYEEKRAMALENNQASGGGAADTRPTYSHQIDARLKFDAKSTTQTDFRQWPLPDVQIKLTGHTEPQKSRPAFEAQSTQKSDFVPYDLSLIRRGIDAEERSRASPQQSPSEPRLLKPRFDAESTSMAEYKAWPLTDANSRDEIPGARAMDQRPQFEASSTYQIEFTPKS